MIYFSCVGVFMIFSGLYYYYIMKVVILKYGLAVFGLLFFEYYVLIDWVSLFFFGVVMMISGMVFCYSVGYMEGDGNVVRFMLILVFFVLSMGLFIFSPHIVGMLLGWDGLGLVSYCLVIYYQNFKSYGAGMLTVLSNRLGDVGLLLCIGFMVELGGWGIFDYVEGDFNFLGWLLFISAITSSAQMPFSAWLPAAMAAPTPVSSLVHSSTLVTAGVFLVIRLSSYFFNGLCYFVFIISVMTMFMAGIGAVFENDVKSVIALSTLSQLGLMLSIVGFGGGILAFYHLIIHAIFKSLMFLCAGYLIHQVSGNQDLRYLGGAGLFSPMVVFFFNVSNFSLCGMPFFSGFYSKDMIIDMMVFSGSGFGGYLIFMLSCGFTVVYSFKVFMLLSVREVNYKTYEGLCEMSVVMMAPMIFLVCFGLLGGSLLFWLIFGEMVFILSNLEKVIIIFVVIMGVLGGIFLKNLSLISSFFCYFFSGMWFLVFLSIKVVKIPFSYGRFIVVVNEFGWDEIFGGGGSSMFLPVGGSFVSLFQNYNLKVYLMGLFFWLMIVFIFV